MNEKLESGSGTRKNIVRQGAEFICSEKPN